MNVEVGDEVHARCSDGITYVGTVTQLDSIRLEVEVKFEDGDKFWTRYSDLRLVAKKETSKDRCRQCFGTQAELVICIECNEGFHPKCHVPHIDPNERDKWMCRFCILSRCATPGGMKNSPIYNTVLKEHW